MKQELYKTNYAVAVDWCNNNYVLCNNLPNIDHSVFDNLIGTEYYEETNEDYTIFDDIYQWYIIANISARINQIGQPQSLMAFGSPY